MEDRQPNVKVAYHFWQRGGGFDGNLTEPSTIWRTIDDIHANPVLRGLSVRPIDGRGSNAIEMQRAGEGDLGLDLESLPRTRVG